MLLWIIIIVLVVLWASGSFGHRISSGFPATGGWIHTLLVIALILIILKLLGVI
ncbi:MAG: lmo0937 family membrane protein [Anaerolineae bacterium]